MDSEPDSLYILLIPLLSLPSVETFLLLILIGLLLVCSALVSGAEVAFFSLSPNDIEKLKSENSSAGNRILKLLDYPRRLLAIILISNNFINISMVVLSDYFLRLLKVGALSEFWASELFLLYDIPFFSQEFLGRVFTFTITVVGVTFLLVLFGEITPKVYAKINNIRLAKLMSGSLFFLGNLLQPGVNLLVKGTSFIEKRYAARIQNGKVTSREDIDKAIELTVRDEINSEQEIDILKGIVKFGDVMVKQIMRTRVDVIALDFRMDFKKLLETVGASGFSRIPVYDEEFDSITGILYVKDLLSVLDEEADFEWQELIRPEVLYVPEAKKINDLLKEFQEKRMHIAVVVDEYGGSAGIVTLEDIMEEVIGEIKDEFDNEKELEYEQIDDYNYIFEGKTLLNDVCRVVKIDTTTFDDVKGDSDSVAGLLLEFVGNLPKKGAVFNIHEYSLKVVEVDKRRIIQIQITLPKHNN